MAETNETQVPASTDVPSQETQSQEQATAPETKPTSEVILSKEEYEELLTAKGRASKEARERLKMERERDELKRKLPQDEDEDYEKTQLKQRLKEAEQTIMLEKVTRKVDDALANSILPDSTKKLIRNSPLAIIDQDSLVSTKEAEYAILEVIEDLEKIERLKQAKEVKSETPEFSPETPSSPPAPTVNTYEEAKKNPVLRESVQGMIMAKLFGNKQ